MGNFGVIVSLTFNYGRFKSSPSRIYGGLNVKIMEVILNEEGTGKGMCIPRTLLGASLKVGATSLIREMLRTCN